MFTRITENGSLIYLTSYHVRKVEMGNAKVLSSKFWPFTSSDDKESKVIHLIVNWHPEEGMTEDLARELVDTLMQRAGLSFHSSIAYYHTDTALPHVHVLVKPTDISGSPLEFEDLKKILKKVTRQMERDFDLRRTQSNPLKEVYQWADLQQDAIRIMNLPDKWYKGKKDRSKKELFNHALSWSLGHYRFTNLEEFNAVLGLYGAKGVKGEPGHLYFVALNEAGKPTGMPLKARQLSGRISMRILEHKMNLYNEDQAKEEAARHIRVQVDQGLVHSASQKLDVFLDYCRTKGLTLTLTSPKGDINPAIVYIAHIGSNNHWAIHEDSVGQDYRCPPIMAAFHLSRTELIDTLSNYEAYQLKAGPTQDPNQWDLGFKRS
jgi:hypothetical protein